MDRSLHLLQVIREGGGTPGVELRVTEKLRARGHTVRVAGPPEVRDYVERAGFPYLGLPWPEPGERYGDQPLMPQQLLAAERWARRLADLASVGTDALISDSAVVAGPLAARLTGLPSISLMPTVYVADQFASGPAAELVHPANQTRRRLGLAPLDSFLDQFHDVDRVLMLTARELEPPEFDLPDDLGYVGPQLDQAVEATIDPLIPEGPGPLVLVGLSTSEQGQTDLLHRILAALRRTDVRAVVTVGPAVDPADFPGTERIQVYGTVPHGPIMARADAVITHAGHGTVIGALAAGVPLLCLPMGRDQPAVAERVARHRAGLVLDPEAPADRIGDALRRVLDEPGFADGACRLATAIARYPDDLVVREIEAAASRSAPPGISVRELS